MSLNLASFDLDVIALADFNNDDFSVNFVGEALLAADLIFVRPVNSAGNGLNPTINGNTLLFVPSTGTLEAFDVNFGVDFDDAAALDDTLYFQDDTPATGKELFKLTAGSDAVPILVDGGNIIPDEIGSDPRDFTTIDGILYFTANGGADRGRELWRLDPNADPMVAEVVNIKGGVSGNPENLVEFLGDLYFKSARELWRYDIDGQVADLVTADLSPIDADADLPDPAFVSEDRKTLYVRRGEGQIWAYTARNYGYLFSGTDIDAGSIVYRTQDGSSDPESAASVITADPALAGATAVLPVSVVGDVNGDGLDDIGFGQSNLTVTGGNDSPAQIRLSIPDSVLQVQSNLFMNNLEIREGASATVGSFINVGAGPGVTRADYAASLQAYIDSSSTAKDLTGKIAVTVEGEDVVLSSVVRGQDVLLRATVVSLFAKLLGFVNDRTSSDSGNGQEDLMVAAEAQQSAQLAPGVSSSLTITYKMTLVTAAVISIPIQVDWNPSASDTLADLIDLINDRIGEELATAAATIPGIKDDVDAFIGGQGQLVIRGNRLASDWPGAVVGIELSVSETTAQIRPLGLLPKEALGDRLFDDPTIAANVPILAGGWVGDEFRLSTDGSVIDPADDIVAIGDVNRDGFDDVAVIQSANQVDVVLGAADIESIAFAIAATTITGDGMISVSGGDFNGDFKGDLAVAHTTGDDATVSVFLSITEQGPSLTLADADAVIHSPGQAQLVNRLSNIPNIDLNGDRIDDLVLGGGSTVEGTTGPALTHGRSAVILGHRAPSPITDGFIVLENTSVPGSGSFIVDRGTGRPEVFDDAGDPFSLADGALLRFTLLGDGRPGDAIRMLTQDDARFDLIDIEGRLIVGGSRAFDLRAIEARTYFLRVHTSASPAIFTVEFDAPIRGATHETTDLPDRDTIRGGDGDDVLVGNFSIDRIFGNSGTDQFTAELIEIRDIDFADLGFSVDGFHTVIQPDTPQRSTNGILPIRNPDRSDVFVDENLAAAVATALGVPVTRTGGGVTIHEPLLASDLAGISHLDASFLGIKNLDGIEYLINLRSLDLRNNDLTPAGLAAMNPRLEGTEQVGLRHLEDLNLSLNVKLSDISTLTGLDQLRALKLEGTEVVGLSAEELARFPALETLVMPLPVTVLEGQNIAGVEGNEILLALAGAQPWTVLDPDGGLVKSITSSTVVFTPSDNGVFEVTVGGDVFSVIVSNADPEVSLSADLNGITEGQTISIDTPQVVGNQIQVRLIIDGVFASEQIVVTDLGTDDLSDSVLNVELIDPDGNLTSLLKGPSNRSLIFDGVDDAVDVSGGVDFAGGDYTVETWFQAAANTRQMLIFAGDEDNAGLNLPHFLLEVTNTGQLRYLHRLMTGVVFADSTADRFDDGVWHHVAAVRQGTTFKLLVDGVELVSMEVPDPSLAEFDGLSFLRFGRLPQGPAFRSLDGQLDEVRIFDRARTDSEILAGMNTEINPATANLVGYWRLNDGEGTTVLDLSVGGHDGSLVNEPGFSDTDVAPIATRAPLGPYTPESFSEFTFNNDGAYALQVTVDDGDGGTARTIAPFSVDNVAPIADIPVIVASTQPSGASAPGAGKMLTINAGEPLAFDLGSIASLDPGIEDSLSIDWEVSSSNGQAVEAGNTTEFGFTPLYAGIYNIDLTIRDNDGGVASDQLTVTVNPVGVMTPLVPTTPVEGDTLSFDATASTNLPPINIGNGLLPGDATRAYAWRALLDATQVAAGTDESFEFIAENDGIFNIELTITDTIEGDVFVSNTVVTDVHVENENPSVNIVGAIFVGDQYNLAAAETTDFVLQLELSDPSIDLGTLGADELMVTISEGGQVLASGNNLSAGVHPFHFDFSEQLVHTLDVLVEDGDGGMASVILNLAISNVVPQLTMTPITPVNEGQMVAVGGAVTDIGGDVVEATIDFGDGIAPQALALNPDGTFSLDYQYADSGQYTVTVTASDDEGGIRSVSIHTEVQNVAPMLSSFNGDPAVGADVGQVLSYTGAFSDIPADELIAFVDFDDGSALPVNQVLGVSMEGQQQYIFNMTHVFALPGIYDVTLTVFDEDGGRVQQTAMTTVGTPQAQVMDRKIFYNESLFDGHDVNANSNDDQAIDVDKKALLPDGTASFENYTSYTNGINGVMVDVKGLASSELQISDFEFRVGNNSDPNTWSLLTSQATVGVRAGEGLNDSDRVTIIFPNGTIQNQWLQVTVKTQNTGLANADIFYFGNAIGETGNSPTDAIVDVTDMTGVRNNATGSGLPVDIENDYDFDRNGRVNVFDLIATLDHRTNSTTALKLITVPQIAVSSAPLVAVAESPDAAPIPTSTLTTTLLSNSAELEPVDQRKESLIADPVSRNNLSARRKSLLASLGSTSRSLLGRLARSSQYRRAKLIETSDADSKIDQLGQLSEVLKD